MMCTIRVKKIISRGMERVYQAIELNKTKQKPNKNKGKKE